MHLSRALDSILLLCVIPHLVSTSPVALTHARRQDTVIANFQLLGPNADCFDFSFDRDTFSATCVSDKGTLAFSKIDLDACIANDDGNMVYRFDPQIKGGNAFSSCSGCTLNSNTLDLTCSNCATNSGGSQLSTINLDGTTAENGNGVFIRDNGKLSWRAPIVA